MNYASFIEQKSQLGNQSGFTPVFMPDFLFPFQKALVEWAVEKGRAAIFADCGLGKTPMQLVWAQNVVQKINKPVLILTPLSVGAQTVREGAKFGIECKQSRDGHVAAPITVTNYQQLHKFNWQDFGGVVCDECFAPDTIIETFNNGSCNSKEIRHIRPNETIINAAGIDTVKECHRRKITRAFAVRFKGIQVIASENHPWLTQRGWVPSRGLRETDWLLETTEAVRILRGDVLPERGANGESEILREILLSEMAHEATGAFGQGSHKRDSCKDRSQGFPMVENDGKGKGERQEVFQYSPDAQPGNSLASEPDIESDEAQTFRAWRKREGYDGAAIAALGGVTEWMGERVCLVTWKKGSGISNMLQNGHSEPFTQDSNRSGRGVSLLKEGSGQEERCKAGFIRLDSIEVLERGHPDLECYANPNGDIYFYDIGLSRHPSFSIGGALVHNSSILKNHDGALKAQITEFMRRLPYRLLCTATAAPNDYIELGTSSEAIGDLGFMDMVNRFFKKAETTHSRSEEFRSGLYRFRGHAQRDFWRWICSWARAVRKPSDLGFPNDGYELPELQTVEHIVHARTANPDFLFDMPAIGLDEQRKERRRTIEERCEIAASLVCDTGKPAVSWCHLNDEGALLEKLIPGAVEIEGSDSDEYKEEMLEAFASGQLQNLVSKPVISGYGLNWQHCAHQTFFPSHSFEQWYQSIRRCWRFGQLNTVRVDVIASEGEAGVLSNMNRKAAQAEEMFSQLVSLINNELRIEQKNKHIKEQIIPDWL